MALSQRILFLIVETTMFFSVNVTIASRSFRAQRFCLHLPQYSLTSTGVRDPFMVVEGFIEILRPKTYNVDGSSAGPYTVT